MNKKFPDLMEQFNEMCSGRSTCEGCPYEHCSKNDECRAAFVFDNFMANGEKCQNLQKSPLESKKPTLPKWCKVGAWVMNDGELMQINEIDSAYITGKVASRDTIMMHPVMRARELEPVRFRPYSYEEAKKLLGKVMEYVDKNFFAPVHHSALIDLVSRNDNNGNVFINSRRFNDWVDYEATIDGVPFGILEIGEEAMKEVEE